MEYRQWLKYRFGGPGTLKKLGPYCKLQGLSQPARTIVGHGNAPRQFLRAQERRSLSRLLTLTTEYRSEKSRARELEILPAAIAGGRLSNAVELLTEGRKEGRKANGTIKWTSGRHDRHRTQTNEMTGARRARRRAKGGGRRQTREENSSRTVDVCCRRAVVIEYITRVRRSRDATTRQ